MKRHPNQRVVVMVTIDTECDHDPRWVRSKPLGFRSINEGLPDLLQPAFESVGAVPTYLLTVEVMEDAASVRTLQQLKGRYEYGTHLHSAFIEPEKKHFDYAGVDSPDFQTHCAPEVEHAKLANLSDLFERCFGRRPTSFRAGRYGAGVNTISSLERLGYLVDTSVTPYIRWPHPDGPVDYRGAPEQPYFVSPESLARPGPRRPLLEVPVTMKPRLLRSPRWFRPWFATVEQMKTIIDYQLRRHAAEPLVVLNMMFHSMEVTPAATPYPQTEGDVRRFIDDMCAGLAYCRQLGAQAIGASEVHALHAQAYPAGR
jgi:hypothetical protein